MRVKVDASLCNQCGRCVDYCPEDVLRMDGDQLLVRYPDECWGCGVCELECPTGAVQVVFDVQRRLLALE